MAGNTCLCRTMKDFFSLYGPFLLMTAYAVGFNVIHSSPNRWDWRLWFENAGVDISELKQERLFDTEEMAIRAAITGMGIAVVDINLVQSELNDGRLVTPVDFVVREGTGYYLFAKHGRFQERKIQAFVDWIVKKAKLEEEDNNLPGQSVQS